MHELINQSINKRPLRKTILPASLKITKSPRDNIFTTSVSTSPNAAVLESLES